MKFIKPWLKTILWGISLLIGLIAIIAFCFTSGLDIFRLFQEIIQQIATLAFWQNMLNDYQDFRASYTLLLVFTSLFCALLLFLIYAFFYRFFSTKHLHYFQQFLDLLENLPVVAVVLFLQWSFIQLYKHFGIHLLSTIGTPRIPVYFVPFLILTIFPVIFLLKYMTPFIKECYQSNYFLFACSLGYDNSALFIKYILPNLIRPLETIIGVIYLEMISVMLFIELQFNTGGILTGLQTVFDFRNPTPELTMLSCLIILLIPYSILKMSFKVYHLKKS